jgi:hypothetical protein
MLKHLFIPVLPAFLLTLGAIPLVVMVTYLRRRASVRRSPLTLNMLRPPGYSLRLEKERLEGELQTQLTFAMMIPLMAFVISEASKSSIPSGPVSFWSFVVFTGIAEALVYRKFWKLYQELQPKALGLEGEMFVGEELNQLIAEGCRVFHDVPIDFGNVDHVVVSPTGVYAVNTKMLRKPRRFEGDGKITVNYSDDVIQLPDRVYQIPRERLLMEAKGLSSFLSESVGEPIEVKPILALPGWFIKQRIGEGPVTVISPRNSSQFFLKKPERLSGQQMKQIAYQLDHRCRDVEPQDSHYERWESRK